MLLTELIRSTHTRQLINLKCYCTNKKKCERPNNYDTTIVLDKTHNYTTQRGKKSYTYVSLQDLNSRTLRNDYIIDQEYLDLMS